MSTIGSDQLLQMFMASGNELITDEQVVGVFRGVETCKGPVQFADFVKSKLFLRHDQKTLVFHCKPTTEFLAAKCLANRIDQHRESLEDLIASPLWDSVVCLLPKPPLRTCNQGSLRRCTSARHPTCRKIGPVHTERQNSVGRSDS